MQSHKSLIKCSDYIATEKNKLNDSVHFNSGVISKYWISAHACVYVCVCVHVSVHVSVHAVGVVRKGMGSKC